MRERGRETVAKGGAIKIDIFYRRHKSRMQVKEWEGHFWSFTSKQNEDDPIWSEQKFLTFSRANFTTDG